MTIGERIREHRLKCGYTLAEVADLIGVKEATVQRYESGEIKNIKHTTITKLASLFNTTPAYLVGWEYLNNKAIGITIGERIRQKREELNMTQEELAFNVGYTSRSSVAKVESNANGMLQSKLALFAKALNTTPAYLMGWENDSPKNKMDDAVTSITSPLRTSPRFLICAELLSNLTEDQLSVAEMFLTVLNQQNEVSK